MDKIQRISFGALPRKRSSNWSEEETDALTAAMKHKQEVIDNFDKSPSFRDQRIQAWEWITACVNRVNTHPRTTQQVKEKWQNYSALIRQKISNDEANSSRDMTDIIFGVDRQSSTMNDSNHGDQELEGEEILENASRDSSIIVVTGGDDEDRKEIPLSMIGATAFIKESAINLDSVVKHQDDGIVAAPPNKLRKTDNNNIDFTRLEHERRMEIMETEHQARMAVLNRESKLINAKLEMMETKRKIANESLRAAVAKLKYYSFLARNDDADI